MGNPRWSQTTVPRYLPDRVSQIYYAHGLFCSSHPILVSLFTVIVIFLCCCPLINVPFFGNLPVCFYNSSASSVNIVPSKYHSPKIYVQQIVMKSSVSPWNNQLILTDAFRAPLAESFKLLEIVHNYQHNDSSLSLDNVCLHVENIKQNLNKANSLLPEYNCLILSPSYLWNQDYNKFQMDTNLINTIYNHQNMAKVKVTPAEILFGLPLKDSGIKRYSVRSKQRVIRFSITLFMSRHDPLYMKGLHDYLRSLYPTQKVSDVPKNMHESFHICYPEETDYSILVPLSITYIVVFLYVYYLAKKMEYIRSKIGITISAVLTVLGSLLITSGSYFFFGFELTSKSGYKQVFPYLVIIFGVENVLVLMKSVVSTLPHLDAKIRVAQGLSKEGWNITKNLLVEVTILTAGLLTFVPAIQEFCIFAIFGVLSDFFLQLVFFSTMLSIYIRCTEHCTYPQLSYYTLSSPSSSRHQNYQNYTYPEDSRRSALPRSRSQPKLFSQNVFAALNSNSPTANRLPKRVKVIHFWARTRIVQRCFMIGMVGWIAAIAYNGGTLHNFISSNERKVDENDVNIQKRQKTLFSWNNISRIPLFGLESKLLQASETNKIPTKLESANNPGNSSDKSWMNSVDFDVRKRLPPYHWSSILSFYNLSLSGSCITVLPPLHLIHQIKPETAEALRNPNEKGLQFRWQSLAIALDPLDFTDLESTVKNTILGDGDSIQQPLLPSSPVEIVMMAALCITSTAVVVYAIFVLYKCICSRNYAEWRTSWVALNSDETSVYATQVILEAVPISIQGHSHQIECMSSDGNVIVSSCLAGQVKIWDSVTGALVQEIDRRKFAERANGNNNNNKVMAKSNNDNSEFHLTSLLPDDHINENNSFSFGSFQRHHTTTIDHKIKELSSFSNEFYEIQQPTDVTTEHSEQMISIVQSVNNENAIENISQNDDNQSINENREFVNTDHYEIPSLSTVNNNNNINNNDNNIIPIWCMDCKENLIVLGYMDGTLEFWECTTGSLKCTYSDQDYVGMTTVKITGRTVIAGKLNGYLGFYRLDVLPSERSIRSFSPYTKHRRGHTRAGSTGSIIGSTNVDNVADGVQCVRIELNKAHSKTITILEAENGKAISGSQDHTLKVFSLDDQRLLYNLIGHHGPITCIFIDRIITSISASGSQDGLLCVWDLHTGTCMYSIQAHDGAVCTLTYSASYIISLGLDERLCIWDRFQGHLLNTVQLTQSYCTSLTMLTHSLLITSKQGYLMVIDVTTGEIIRMIKLGHCDSAIFIKHIINLGDGIVCDYGEQLKLIKFPLVCDKSD